MDFENVRDCINGPTQNRGPKEKTETAEPYRRDPIKQPRKKMRIAPDQQRSRHKTDRNEDEEFQQVWNMRLAPKVIHRFENQCMRQQQQALNDGNETPQTPPPWSCH